MITSWQIFDTKYQTADGLIIKVTYGCTVQLERYIKRTIGELELTGDPSTEGFIAYSNVTEETILGWVQNFLGAETVTAIEVSLQNNVIAQKQAIEAEAIKSGLPWRD
jgi:hypothetical protein